MKTYYVCVKEIGRTVGLFSTLNYVALFVPSLRLGETREQLESKKKSQNLMARITAVSLEDLADGLVVHAGTVEKLCTVQNERTNHKKCAILLGNDGEESYVELEKIERLKRGGKFVFAVTSNGEKRSKTFMADCIEGEIDFVVRQYSQIPIENVGYSENAIVKAWQQNSPLWRWSMRVETSFTRDLSLREQRSLGQRIEATLKQRGDFNWKPVKLIDVNNGNYPLFYEVVRAIS
ncbi:TPA: hypothetical protein HA241_02395 [Candidatus Woesearchaeota archaeon]|nr:hypothetical protein [Candidatus Woesearchaeota archaeon]